MQLHTHTLTHARTHTHTHTHYRAHTHKTYVRVFSRNNSRSLSHTRTCRREQTRNATHRFITTLCAHKRARTHTGDKKGSYWTRLEGSTSASFVARTRSLSLTHSQTLSHTSSSLALSRPLSPSHTDTLSLTRPPPSLFHAQSIALTRTLSFTSESKRQGRPGNRERERERGREREDLINGIAFTQVIADDALIQAHRMPAPPI